MNPERRRSPREKLHSLVYFDLQPNNGGIVLDLGVDGMRISLAHPLSGVEEVRFSLNLRPGKRIRGTGRIAWISSSGKNAGVCFISLPREELGQILPCLDVPPGTPESMSGESEQHENARPMEADSTTEEVETVSALASPQPEIVIKPSGMVGEAGPSILSLYGQDGPEKEFPTSGEPLEGWTADDAGLTVAEGEQGARAGVSPPQEEIPAVVGGGGEGQERNVGDVPEDARPPVPSRQQKAPPPPAWLEALAEAGRRDRWEDVFPKAWEPKEGSKSEPPESAQTEPVAVDAASEVKADVQTDESPAATDSKGVLYLPNYWVEPDRRTGDVRLTKLNLRDGSQFAANLACERLEEFGWTLERDWHIWVALVLLVAGFLALAQKPPLVLIAGALWLASAFIAVKRKQRPRSDETSGPDDQ